MINSLPSGQSRLQWRHCLAREVLSGFRLIELRTCWLFFVHQKAPEGGLLLIGQLAFRLSEKLVNEMSSDTIAPHWPFEIASDNAIRA